MMSERDYAKLFVPDVVHDTIGKLPQRKPAPTLTPRCAKLWMGTKEGECSFELRDEGKANFGISLAGVEDRAFG
jgi:hypothetical protein